MPCYRVESEFFAVMLVYIGDYFFHEIGLVRAGILAFVLFENDV